MANDIFPLGFHAGNTGHYPADLIHAVNQRGLRAFVKVIDDDGRAEEALRIGAGYGIENVAVLRISSHRAGQDTEAPDTVLAPDKPIEQSADEWWGRHIGEINKLNAARARGGSQPLDKRVWLELANETNRNTYREQGEMFAIIARKYALPGGWRICVPGSNSGEPESWAGWEDYFRLCALHPDQLAVAIHYYEWRMGDANHPQLTFAQSVPHLVGREYKIYELCDQLNINYPTIHVTEGGFKHDWLPGWNPQMADYMAKLARHIGEQPNMTGLAFWCAQRYQGNIHHTFKNDYVPQFIAMAGNWVAPPQLARANRPDPIIPDDGDSQGGDSGNTGDNGGAGGDASGGQAAVASNKATGALGGVEARAFGLGHDGHPNRLRVNQPIWFHFEFHNGGGQDRPFGGMGVLAWRWQEADNSWQQMQWQNSFGGFNDRLGAGQSLRHGDHIKLNQQGIFALCLGITTDAEARSKLDRPADIQAMQLLREPVYINVGPHFSDGQVLATPPAPLFQVDGGASGTGEGGGDGDTGGGDPEPAGKPWTPGRHQNVYLLAPVSLNSGERQRLYQLAWDGVELPSGQKTSGKHTVTFSHDDAFDNNVRGAAGSLLIIVEPQRIGTGIDDNWMRANAANINYVLHRLQGDGVDFGVGGEGESAGPEDGHQGGDGGSDGALMEGWIWNNGLQVDESVTPARVTLGRWLNVRLGPGREDFPEIQGVLDEGTVVEARGPIEKSYMPVRFLRSVLKPDRELSTGIPKPLPGKYSGPKVTFHDGVHGPGDAHTWHNAAFRGMLQNLNMPVKFMSDGDRANWFTGFNKPELSLVRVFWKPDMSRRKTPRQAWEEDIRDGVRRFYDRGARDFEVHNEPRLHHEGFGHQWHNGAEFGDFLLGLMRIIKAECPEARLWYPGESPGVPWTDQFLVSRPAFRKVADMLSGICMHAYSGVTDNVEVAASEIANQVRAYRDALYNHGQNPEVWQLPIIVSECSVNRAPAAAGDAFAAYRADVYKRTAAKLSRIAGVKGVFWYTSHWNPPPNEVANQESWFGTSLPDTYKRMMGR